MLIIYRKIYKLLKKVQKFVRLIQKNIVVAKFTAPKR